MTKQAGGPKQRGYILLLVPMILVGISILAIRSMDRSRTSMRISGAELNYMQTGLCAQQCAALAVNSAAKKLNDNLPVTSHTEPCNCNPTNQEAITCNTSFTSIRDTGITNCYDLVMNRTTMDISVSCKQGLGEAQSIQENIAFSEYPIFQFAVFFQQSMEIAPGGPLSITGRVHSNDTIRMSPGGWPGSGNLMINDWVTSPKMVEARTSGHGADVCLQKSDGSGSDCMDFSNATYSALENIISGWTSWQKVHKVAYADKVGGCGKIQKLSVPLRDTANTHAIIEWRDSPKADGPDLKSQKFAWRAKLIYKGNAWYNNDMTTATLSAGNPVATPASGVTTTGSAPARVTFPDSQQTVTLQLVPIDLVKLRQRSTDDIIYLHDSLMSGGKDVGGFLLYNGKVQSRPLTIVSNSRIYMWGDFNTTAGYSTGGVMKPYPVAIISDVYTQLSNVWTGNAPQDGQAGYVPIRLRTGHGPVTLNACIMSGMAAPGGVWAGGYHNSVHYMENWDSTTINFTGSSAYLWSSSKHYGTVTTKYYGTPDRNFTFDAMYKKIGNMPPGTPRLVEPKLNDWQLSRR